MITLRLSKCCVGATLLLSLAAQARDLIVLVDTGTEMPMARFEQGQLVGGIHKDIGDALAAKTNRSARFLALPRKRIANALETGGADILCSYVPEWLDGRFDWSKPFIPIAEVLIADRGAKRPASLADVAGQPVGTVLGYVHPELEEVLGKRLVREDAPTAEVNLRKLAAGRIKYALTSQTLLEYRLKLGDPPLSLHPPLMVKTYMGQCAVSRKGRVSLAEIDKSIESIIKDGTLTRIMRRYR
ncbi:MAG TPA: transporter substrate-binding domain-containing protein [Paucimonas sp.]|nr:transporter substrate-binding domain-containing protein [Paucimonas sp.]